MKKEYLKTYVKTLVIFLILAVIVCIVGYFFKSEYDDEQFETTKTDMLMIEAKTKILAQKIKMKEKNVTYVGKKIEEVKDEEIIKKMQEKQVINLEEKKNKYYILEKSHLEELGLTITAPEEGYYIVEYNKNEIIYTKGIEDKNGNVIYKLSELEEIEK